MSVLVGLHSSSVQRQKDKTRKHISLRPFLVKEFHILKLLLDIYKQSIIGSPNPHILITFTVYTIQDYNHTPRECGGALGWAVINSVTLSRTTTLLTLQSTGLTLIA